MITTDEVRQRLESGLGGPVAEQEWSFLVRRNYIREVQEGETTIAQLVEEVREHRRSFGRSQADRPNAPRMLDNSGSRRVGEGLEPRQHALSLLFAHHARQRPDLVLFRRSHLAGGLLSREKVEEWIAAQASTNAPPTRWWEVPVPADVRFLNHDEPGQRYTYDRRFRDRLAGPAQMAWTEHRLAYGVPSDHYERTVPTHAGGALESLRRLSARLSEAFRWGEAQATVFVLTDVAPIVEPITAETKGSYPISAASRVILSIDPALSPREVADYYRLIRRSAFGGMRHRPQTEKHIQLALFSALRPKGETWAEQMAAWNAEHPEWRYAEVTNFHRDCTTAQRRLLRPNWGQGAGDDEE